MSKSVDREFEGSRDKAIITLFWCICFVGVLPVGLHFIEIVSPGLISGNHAGIYASITQPHSSLVFLVLFLGAGVLAVLAKKPFLPVAALPLLFLSIWPLVSERNAVVPAPIGAIVAFETDCDDITGWKHYDKLAGRFPRGVNRNSDQPVESGKPGGSPTAKLEEHHMPPHSHELTTNNANIYSGNRGSNGTNFWHGFKTGSTKKGEFEHQPFSVIPPFSGVFFCFRG